MPTTKNPLTSIILLFISLLFLASDAQDISDVVSNSPSQMMGRPTNTPSANPGEPTTTPTLSVHSTTSPTLSECADDPGWYYEYWDWDSCPRADEKKILKLGCDDSRVGCSDSYGRLGWAQFSCCKCKFSCAWQCKARTITDDGGGVECTSYNADGYDDDNTEEDLEVEILQWIAFVFLCIFVIALTKFNEEGQHDARLESNRQTMATRRQQQLESNSQGLTEEEQNHARYELFKTKFHFQKVLPDKSNITATSVRSLATTKTDPEEQDNDDASAVGISERPLKSSISRRYFSSWRRPSSEDECCICLECYNVGETICAPITTECNHCFHEGCIHQWFKNNDKCPLCRVELK